MSDRDIISQTASHVQDPMLVAAPSLDAMLGGGQPLALQAQGGQAALFGGVGDITTAKSSGSEEASDDDADNDDHDQKKKKKDSCQKGQEKEKERFR